MEEQSEYFFSSKENTRTNNTFYCQGDPRTEVTSKREDNLEEKFGEWGYFLEKRNKKVEKEV
ncbi:hypothetical protein HZC31_00285 [Candidatus Woesearchaeota archaeon]|nr:hypothetical protein [Candidatus Woesearchaeota archaeon]